MHSGYHRTGYLAQGTIAQGILHRVSPERDPVAAYHRSGMITQGYHHARQLIGFKRKSPAHSSSRPSPSGGCCSSIIERMVHDGTHGGVIVHAPDGLSQQVAFKALSRHFEGAFKVL